MTAIASSTASILGSVGGIVTGIGQLTSAREENRVGEFNAQLFEQRSRAARESQKLLEFQKRKEIDTAIGRQVALYAKSGVKLSGSALEVMADSLANAELDIAIDRYNTEVEARGFANQANLSRYEANQRARQRYARASNSFLSNSVDLLRIKPILNKKGTNLGAGTTSQGIRVPSRFVPPR